MAPLLRTLAGLLILLLAACSARHQGSHPSKSPVPAIVPGQLSVCEIRLRDAAKSLRQKAPNLLHPQSWENILQGSTAAETGLDGCLITVAFAKGRVVEIYGHELAVNGIVVLQEGDPVSNVVAALGAPARKKDTPPHTPPGRWYEYPHLGLLVGVDRPHETKVDGGFYLLSVGTERNGEGRGTP